MKILIIEDEQRAGEKLRDLVEKHTSKPTEIHWTRSVSESVLFLTQNSPDIIFSDIELLDGNAFEIYKQIEPRCPIIFCTAYNQFFLEAFKTNGIAYLLKPYTEDDFTEALLKYKKLFQEKPSVALTNKNLLEGLQNLLSASTKKYKQTFTVKKTSGVYILNVSEVTYFQAQGDFIFAFDSNNHKHIINHSLTSVEQMIDPTTFFRINRSEIINFHFIEKYYAYIKNRLEIFLKDAKATTLYTSNSKSSEFKSWINNK